MYNEYIESINNLKNLETIINFIQKVESIPFRQVLKKAYEILEIPINLPSLNKASNHKVNKNNAVQFYNNQAKP